MPVSPYFSPNDEKFYITDAKITGQQKTSAGYQHRSLVGPWLGSSPRCDYGRKDPMCETWVGFSYLATRRNSSNPRPARPHLSNTPTLLYLYLALYPQVNDLPPRAARQPLARLYIHVTSSCKSELQPQVTLNARCLKPTSIRYVERSKRRRRRKKKRPRLFPALVSTLLLSC